MTTRDLRQNAQLSTFNYNSARQKEIDAFKTPQASKLIFSTRGPLFSHTSAYNVLRR